MGWFDTFSTVVCISVFYVVGLTVMMHSLSFKFLSLQGGVCLQVYKGVLMW